MKRRRRISSSVMGSLRFLPHEQDLRIPFGVGFETKYSYSSVEESLGIKRRFFVLTSNKRLCE